MDRFSLDGILGGKIKLNLINESILFTQKILQSRNCRKKK